MKPIRWSPKITEWHSQITADAKNKRLSKILTAVLAVMASIVAVGYWNIASSLEKISLMSSQQVDKDTQVRERQYQDLKELEGRKKTFTGYDWIRYNLRGAPNSHRPITALELGGNDATPGEDVPVLYDQDLSALNDATQLESLSLSDTQITSSGLKEISHKKLSYLGLDYSLVCSLSPIAKMTTCTGLSLEGTRVKDDSIRSISNWRQLEDLNLSKTEISDESLPVFSKFSNLETLELMGCKHVTLKGVQQLEKTLPDCTVYFCHYRDVGDVPLPKGTNPNRVLPSVLLAAYIGGAPNCLFMPASVLSLKDADLEALTGATGLEFVDFERQEITENGLAKLKSTNLKALVLVDTKTRRLDFLKGMQRLTRLYLDRTPLEGSAYPIIGTMQSLETLSICGTKINGAELKNLYGLHRLRYLSIGACTRISKIDCQELGKALPGCEIKTTPSVPRFALQSSKYGSNGRSLR